MPLATPPQHAPATLVTPKSPLAVPAEPSVQPHVPVIYTPTTIAGYNAAKGCFEPSVIPFRVLKPLPKGALVPPKGPGDEAQGPTREEMGLPPGGAAPEREIWAQPPPWEESAGPPRELFFDHCHATKVVWRRIAEPVVTMSGFEADYVYDLEGDGPLDGCVVIATVSKTTTVWHYDGTELSSDEMAALEKLSTTYPQGLNMQDKFDWKWVGPHGPSHRDRWSLDIGAMGFLVKTEWKNHVEVINTLHPPVWTESKVTWSNFTADAAGNPDAPSEGSFDEKLNIMSFESTGEAGK